MAISRELTQKLKSANSDSDDDNMEFEEIDISKIDSKNPWVNGIKPEKEVSDFVSGFRKYWQEHNKSMTANGNVAGNSSEKKNDVEKSGRKPKIIKEKGKPKKKILKQNKNVVPLKSPSSTSEWEVCLLNSKAKTNNEDVDTIFETLEEKIKKKIKKDYGKLKNLTKKNKIKKMKSLLKKSKKIDLAMKPIRQKQIIDEELLENTEVEETGNEKSAVHSKKVMSALNIAENKPEHVNINPEKFLEVKKTVLQSAIPDLSIPNDNEEDSGNQKHLILEAFEDDDITEDFKKDKAKVIDEDTPKDIDLTLPGWGSWAGSGIKPSKRKNRRLILKMPPVPPRKDQNKGSLIINEKAQSKIKPLLVSEIPFPFKTVKDYEAAIRAPIGNTFVPERAFKKLIEPNVTTKMGAVIEPITRNVLMGRKSV